MKKEEEDKEEEKEERKNPDKIPHSLSSPKNGPVKERSETEKRYLGNHYSITFVYPGWSEFLSAGKQSMQNANANANAIFDPIVGTGSKFIRECGLWFGYGCGAWE